MKLLFVVLASLTLAACNFTSKRIVIGHRYEVKSGFYEGCAGFASEYSSIMFTERVFLVNFKCEYASSTGIWVDVGDIR